MPSETTLGISDMAHKPDPQARIANAAPRTVPNSEMAESTEAVAYSANHRIGSGSFS